MDRAEVPPPPPGVIPHVDQRGDEVYDHRRSRWRYRGGELFAYVEYRSDSHELLRAGRNPWRRAWSAGVH